MIEATMAMVILAIAAAGILLPFSSACKVQDEAQRRVIATRLAADMLEKIAATPYANIISNYNGVNQAAGSLTDNAGRLLSDAAYKNLSRSISCQSASVAGVNLIWAQVDVKYNGNSVNKLGMLIGDKYKH